jgi:hypothetical protein
MARSKRDIVFTEAAGKTVESIKYEEAFDWQAIVVSFSDGTLFSFELSARVTAHANYLQEQRGNLKLFRKYGKVSGNSGRRA